jgi:hypothetical protein
VVAPTGSIAISEATRKLVEGYFLLKALGPTLVKGLAEPVNVYEVTGLGPLRSRLQRAAGRGLTRFVGREAELAQMRRALESARAGHGQVVAAMGLRVFILDYFRKSSTEDGHSNAGHGRNMFMSQQQDRWMMRDIRTRRSTRLPTDGSIVRGQ